MAVVHLLLLAAFYFQYIKRLLRSFADKCRPFPGVPRRAPRAGTGWALWVVGSKSTFESRVLLAVCALCLDWGEAEAAWDVLLCSELKGAGGGATSYEAAVLIPQPSLTYGMSQEDKLDLDPKDKILPVSFSGKGLVEPKDIPMISCTLLSNCPHQSLPKFCSKAPHEAAMYQSLCWLGCVLSEEQRGMMVTTSTWLWVIGNTQAACDVLWENFTEEHFGKNKEGEQGKHNP